MQDKKELDIAKLVQAPDSYKINIPEKVEAQIRLFCSKVWNLEWSGVLFYTVTGNFQDNNLEIHCKDICLMDVGTSGRTSFDMSAEVAGYMADNSELWEPGIYQGLIHSHNTMTTFFSNTDTDTLFSEGLDMPHFVSLIVNNAGVYKAAITRQCELVNTAETTAKYPTWGGEIQTQSEETVTISQAVVYHYLDINFTYETPHLSESKDRMDELILAQNKKKEEEANRTKFLAKKGTKVSRTNPYLGNNFTNTKPLQVDPSVQLPKSIEEYNQRKAQERNKPYIAESVSDTKEDYGDLFDFEDPSIPYGIVKTNPLILEGIIKQLLTGSVFLKSDAKVDIEKWAASMNKIYATRFANRAEFKEFAGFFVEYLITSTYDEELDAYFMGEEAYIQAVLAEQIREELSNLPKNEWLDYYISELDNFIL